MKRMRLLSTFVMALLLVGLVRPPHPARSQEGKKQQPGTTPGLPTTKTKLEVKRFSGDLEQWEKTLTIESPQSLTFRYSTDEPGAVTAFWEVSDKPFPGNSIAAGQAPNVIASGALGSVPAKGNASSFEINFAQFAPKTAPAKPLNYWVHVVTKNAQQQPVGLASASVKVVYLKSSPQTVDLTGIPVEKPVPMTIGVSLNTFTVHQTNEGEGDDDPYLFVVVVYADGTTINIKDLAHGSVRLDSPGKTHNNLGMDAFSNEPRSGHTYPIPASTGRFVKDIFPLAGGLSGQDAANLSQVAVIVVLMEEDATQDSTADAGRKALVDNLQQELDAAVRAMKLPDLPSIQERVKEKVIAAIKKETLKDWWTPWGLFDAADPDDFIASNFASFTYAQIRAAGTKGLPIKLECKGAEGWYTIEGVIGKG